MTEAATTSDPLKLADAGLSLRKRLQELWRLRKAREDEWAEVLNFLQSALSGAFERFTVVQCNAVARVIEDHLAQGAVDDDQPSKVRRMLREAGLDPWRAISQPEDTK
jgi:hypothetical protein